jgi:hypothetical protein
VKARTIRRSALALAATLLITTATQALAVPGLFRAYLASDGNDANPCTLAAPCRLLPAALTAVVDGGEIWMLDSANYNAATVTIGKSVSILAVPGAVGSVLAIGGPAISITAASLKVALRNLVIGPLAGGGGTLGIFMTGASTLFVENSLFANLPASGVVVSGTGKLKITDAIIRNNGEFAVILQNGASGGISGTKMLENAMGGILTSSTTASTTTANVSDSVISGGLVGVHTYAAIVGANATLFLTRSTIEGTLDALRSQTSGLGSALVTASGSMITNNGNAWYQYDIGSVVNSLGNNHIQGNSGSYGSLTPAVLQ